VFRLPRELIDARRWLRRSLVAIDGEFSVAAIGDAKLMHRWICAKLELW
jgi:hypothetical protein